MSEVHVTGFERYRGVLVRVGAIIVVIVGIALGVRYLLGSGPAEKYRVAHPAGYSVIRPSDWRAGIVTTTDADGFVDSILLSPESWRGLEPMMWVKRYAAAPDFQKLQAMGFKELPFQGRPAWINQVKPKRHLIRTAIIQRGNDWYNAGVSLPDLEALKVDDWWRYIESFQPPRTTSTPDKPASRPASADSP